MLAHHILSVEASAIHDFGNLQWPAPNVRVVLAPPLRQQLFALTESNVGQPLKIIIGGRCVSEAVVREPLGNSPHFWISAHELKGAEALAEVLIAAWKPLTAVCSPDDVSSS